MYGIELSTPKSELYNRINKFKEYLSRNNIEAALILQKSDLFYFSGTVQQAYLYISVQRDPILLVQKDVERAIIESAIDKIVAINSIRKIPDLLKANGYVLPITIGIEQDVLPVNIYLKLKEIFSDSEFMDVSHFIRLVRSVKSEYELVKITESSRLTDKLTGSIKDFLHEGIKEIELAGQVEARARELEHQGIVRMRIWDNELFYGHLMSGLSAAVPSYLSSPTGGCSVSPAVGHGPGRKKINRNEPVLVDYAFAHKGYIADQSRIFSIGKLDDDLLLAHEAMLKIQEIIKNAAKPGIPSGELYRTAIEAVDDMGYGDYFMGAGERRIRFIGHGVGLELDEYPFIAHENEMKLEKNMVIALEPKLVIPGKGVVGIENTHVVSDEGLKQLTVYEESVIDVEK